MMTTKPWIIAALMAAAFHNPLYAKEAQTYQTSPVTVSVSNQTSAGELTLEQIMADPDWMQRAAERPVFSLDGQHIYYQQKRQGSELRDWYKQSLQPGSQPQQVAMADWHLIAEQRINSADGQRQAWLFEGNVFVQQQGQVKQITRSSVPAADLMFLADNRLLFRQGWTYLVADPSSGAVSELVSLKAGVAPKAPQVAEGYLAQQQHQLIEFIAKKQQNAEQKYQRQQELRQQNNSLAAAAVYVGKGKDIVTAAMSPLADQLLVVVEEDASWRDDRDIMPNYITPTGDIAAEEVRRRVADQEPQSQQLLLVDLNTGAVKELSYDSLPGFDEDVLAAVKTENAKAEGKKYQSKKAPRAIGLMNDWGWRNGAVQWHSSGKQLAIMLEAWDNKDRWLVTVDFKQHKLVTQHRLHDDAWVNYNFNEFGWLHQDSSLYYLSEESGYAHLYLKPLNGKAKKLTAGTYEVNTPVLSQNDQYLYFKGNVSHPGIYEVYRVALSNGQLEQMTALKGSADFMLSPDEQSILLNWSNSVTPPDLYSMPNQPKAAVSRLTHTTTAAFDQQAWLAPQVIAVPSSHGSQPVFAKLYLPKDWQQGEKRRAVIFSHGAGYLQNSDLGWSGYFREYFFHNLLVQKGYVVLDMDYRASKGYGRDWRTAIYRQMGTPEIQDLADGVNYLVQNAHVDAQRIGTYGGSYGGFMTFMALFTQPDLFKAGAALRPVGDWAYYNYDYTSNILNTPDVDPIAYQRSSPIYFTAGLKSRLLINAPMVDDNVFFQDTVRVVQRLIEQGNANFETAIFPVEPHGFRQPSSWLDEYKRILRLFETEL